MTAFLAVAVLLGGSVYLLSRLLPELHPVRRQVEAAVLWIKQNPDLFEKRFKLVAFILLMSVFALLTVIYS
jgi:hypothetical protein